MSGMYCVKILSNCACSKLDPATWVWSLECISRAGLEQEIENLKKKLAVCTRDNLNLQEELSEAYQIKSQLADLHAVEVAKNAEAEKQLNFFQGCVAAAFAERDNSIMEAEKAKEEEELLSFKLNGFRKRLEELNADLLEQKKLNDLLQVDLEKQEEQNKTFMKVVSKFYEIRQESHNGSEDASWDDKCKLLLHDCDEMWSFNDDRQTSASKYLNELEEELETMRKSVDGLQNKLRVGLEIENHLKKEVRELEKKNFLWYKMVNDGISKLRSHYLQHKIQIASLLDEGKDHLSSTIFMLEENFMHLNLHREWSLQPLRREKKEDDCQDVHVNTDVLTSVVNELQMNEDDALDKEVDAAKALTQALQEKVSALLLLSQQEERHLLERNAKAALQKKINELQRILVQVTNEKVKALVELAQLKQELHLLKENRRDMRHSTSPATMEDRSVVLGENDGRLKNLLKKLYLRRWIDLPTLFSNDAEDYLIDGGNSFGRRPKYSMEFARMKVENAILKEIIESMEHLTSLIHRLRLSLFKAEELVTSQTSDMPEVVDEIISEAKLVKTALGSSLPVSRSAGEDDAPFIDNIGNMTGDISRDPEGEKVDSATAVGFEMVELLIFAAELLKEKIT